MTADPSTYEGLQEIQAILDEGGTGTKVTSRGLPVCPACGAEIEFSACRATRQPTPATFAAVLEVIVAAHRRFSCTREDIT